MEEFSTILNAIEALGTVGILALGVYMFYTGKVIPERIMQKMLDSITTQTQRLADEIKDGMEKAIHHGIVNATHELRQDETKDNRKPHAN